MRAWLLASAPLGSPGSRRVLNPFRRAPPSLLGTRVDEPPSQPGVLAHIAAYGYAILQGGFQIERSSFSRYRSFSRDLISKRRGDGYETDAEFHDSDGRLVLHVEVKTWPEEIDRIATQLDEVTELRRLPQSVVKELEYVLDLAPRYLWIVGPGTVDPPAHVFRVFVDDTNAQFERMEASRSRG